jgi:hypothetical protein
VPVTGHTFQNTSHLNAALLCQVTLFKMPAKPFECTFIVSGHAFQNGSHLNASLLHHFDESDLQWYPFVSEER